MSLNESDLAQFSGSDNWYKHFTGFLYTDGLQYVAETGGAHWLIDAICTNAKHQKKITQNARLRDFQLWILTVKEDKSATLCCYEDSGMPLAFTQKIPYTDFPLKSIKLYLENNTLCLPSER